ncbi:MAG: hypothetical protein EBW08_03515, partial [Pelagibacteraceae bacterium]|nr:hypothetical protein [Pelagibacteraceae bacterium]
MELNLHSFFFCIIIISMYQDFNNLSDFYKTNIGLSLKNLISEKIKKYVFLYDHEHVGFFGFSEPYLDLVKNKKIK